MNGLTAALLLPMIMAGAVARAADGAPQNMEEPDPSSGEEEGPIHITAGLLHYFRERGLWTGEGGITLRQGANRLTSDSLSFDMKRGVLVLRGRIEGEVEGFIVSCEEASIDLKGRTGRFLSVTLQGREGEFTLKGGVVEKRGPSDFSFENGTFTPCLCEGEEGSFSARPAWELEIKEGEIRDGRYLIFRNAGMKVKGRRIPFLKVPYGIFPVRDERTTGFLPPHLLSRSKDGINLELPFFLVTGKGHDLTLSVRFIEERGWQEGAEFRYLPPSGTSAASLWVKYLYDRNLPGEVMNLYGITEEEMGQYGYSRHRWRAGLFHLQNLRSGFHLRWNADIMSDNLYLNDFSDDMGERGLPEIESSGGIGLGRGSLYSGMVLRHFFDLADNVNSDTVQVLPSLEARLLDFGPFGGLLKHLYLGGYLRFENFARLPDLQDIHTDGTPFDDVGRDGLIEGDTGYSGPDPDGSEGNGSFDEGEPVREGEKGDALLGVKLPLRPFKVFELVPSFSFRETLYRTWAGGLEDARREYAEFNLLLSTKLYRVSKGYLGYEKFLNTVEPVIVYEYNPYFFEEEHPVFYPDDLKEPANGLLIGFKDKLLAKRRSGEKVIYGELFEFKVWQELDVGNALEEEGALGDLAGEMELKGKNLNLRINPAFDHDTLSLYYLMSTVRGRFKDGNEVRLDYQRIEEGFSPFLTEDIDQIYGSMTLHVPQILPLRTGGALKGLYLRAGVRYSFIPFDTDGDGEGDRGLISQYYGLKYISPSKCYRVQLLMGLDADLASPTFKFSLELLPGKLW